MEKKQKIYVAVIVLCIITTGGVLYWGYGGTSTPIPTVQVEIDGSRGNTVGAQPAAEISPNVANIPSATTQNEYPAPVVFPDQSSLDLTVFDSSQFSQLKDYTPLTVQPEEIGRENPFVTY